MEIIITADNKDNWSKIAQQTESMALKAQEAINQTLDSNDTEKAIIQCIESFSKAIQAKMIGQILIDESLDFRPLDNVDQIKIVDSNYESWGDFGALANIVSLVLPDTQKNTYASDAHHVANKFKHVSSTIINNVAEMRGIGW